MKKTVYTCLFLAGLGVVGYYAWKLQNPSAPPLPKFERISYGPIIDKVSATGRLVPKDVQPVVTEVPLGKVVWISPKATVGEAVKAGDELAKLDDELVQSRIQEAESAVELARAAVIQAQAAKKKAQAGVQQARYNVEAAQKAYDVADKLKENAKDKFEVAEKTLAAANAGLTFAQAQEEEADAGILTAKANQKKAESALHVAQLGLKAMTIRAPISGVIIDKRISPGQVISVQSTPVLFLIAPDLSMLQVQALVGEADIARIHVGQRAQFTVDAFSDLETVFSGQVSQIANIPGSLPGRTVQVGDTTATVSGPVLYPVTIDLLATSASANHELKPGMTANVDFIVQKIDRALRVPSQALSYRPQALTPEEEKLLAEKEPNGWKPLWLLAAGGRRELVFVKTGTSDGAFTEITASEPANAVREGSEAIIEGPPENNDPIFGKSTGIRL